MNLLKHASAEFDQDQDGPLGKEVQLEQDKKHDNKDKQVRDIARPRQMVVTNLDELYSK